jgi:VWFA-related protein
MSRHRAARAASAVAVVVLTVSTHAQRQEPVFRSGVRTVAIYATVLDEYGDLVRHLSADDFDVRDDGRRQDLTVFAEGFQPITAVVLVDTSQSMTPSLELAQSAAEQFVVRLMPGDTARVGNFSDRIVTSEPFTGDRDVLLRVVRGDLHIGKPTRLWEAIDQAIGALAPLGGRRVIFVATDGADTYSRTPPYDVFARLQVRARRRDLVVRARKSYTAPLAEKR